jgi:hypothetical protein
MHRNSFLLSRILTYDVPVLRKPAVRVHRLTFLIRHQAEATKRPKQVLVSDSTCELITTAPENPLTKIDPILQLIPSKANSDLQKGAYRKEQPIRRSWLPSCQ